MVKETMKNGSNMLGQAEKVQNMDPAQVSSTLVVPIYILWYTEALLGGKRKKSTIPPSTFAKVCFFSLTSKIKSGKPPPELLKPFVLPP